MNNGAFLYTFAGGVLGGVAFALLFSVSTFFVFVCIAISLMFLIVGVLSKKPQIFLLCILFLASALGVLRTNAYLADRGSETVKDFANQKVVLIGIVTNDPERRATSLHAVVEVKKINDLKVQGNVLAVLERYAPVEFGDMVALEGKLEVPQSFETSSGHTFDYAVYLDAKGISLRMGYPKLVGLAQGGWSLQKTLFEVKHQFEAGVEQVFPEPHGALLEGILLGERRGIPQELLDAFVASGLIHIVVLSGHNITIVSEAVFRSLSFLPRTINFTLGGVFMVLFAAMTGFGATTVRALLMALIALLARYMHRSALALRSLALAAAAMVLWNPSTLLYDRSFILSMLATFGLITLAPWVERYLKRVPQYNYFDVRSILATTIAVQIFVTPALLYFSGVFSVFALPANMLALPLVPFAMLFGFIAGVIALVSPTFAVLPVVVGSLLLQMMIEISNLTKQLPGSVAVVGEFSVLWVCAVYIPLTYFAISRYRIASRSQTNSSF